MGLGEAAAVPIGNKMMAYWLGEKERAFGTSIFLAGVGAGGVAAPVLVGWMIRQWGWRACFLLLGAAGTVLAFLIYKYVTNRPEEHPGVNAAELAGIRSPSKIGPTPNHGVVVSKVPWGHVFSSPSMWGLMISHFCLVYPVYIFVTWFFIYLVRVRAVAIPKASLWTSAPFIANLFMVPLWGWLSDRATEKFGKRRGRRATVWLGVACSAGLLWSGSHTANNTLAIAQLAAAGGLNFAASSILWTTCNDIAAKYSGSISGLMTTFGSLGGWLSPILTAAIATRFGWTYALDFAALVTLVSGFAWFLINADQAID